MADIVERLRDRNDLRCLTASMPPQFIKDALCQEAADEIERLREVLRPFAERAAAYGPPNNDDDEPAWWHVDAPTIGDLRRARGALKVEQ